MQAHEPRTHTINTDKRSRGEREKLAGIHHLVSAFYSPIFTADTSSDAPDGGSSQTMSYTIISHHWSRIETTRPRDFT